MNYSQEAEKRAEPFCFCMQPRVLGVPKHHRKCTAPFVAAALLQMARDVRDECAEIAKKLNSEIVDADIISAAIERAGEGNASTKPTSCTRHNQPNCDECFHGKAAQFQKAKRG